MNMPFTAAIMPFLRTTKRDAEWAHRLGHDVIVHLPMEPKRGPKSWLGPEAITTDLPDDEIRRRVEVAIADVPYAVGMNNHMGSKATGDARVMRIVLEVCKAHGFFFLDSKTNYHSIVSSVAKEVGVPTIANHLFFDDITSIRHITQQVRLFQQHLREHDVCVAIGHVGLGGKKTAEVLKNFESELNKQAEIVGLKRLILSQISQSESRPYAGLP